MHYLVIFEKDDKINVEKFRDILKAEDRADTLEQYPVVILRGGYFEDHNDAYEIVGEIVHVQNSKDFKLSIWRKLFK